MPAHRKPTALLNKRYAKAIGRDITSEPRPRGDLTVKPRLPRDVAACWDAIVRLAPAGALKDCDAIAVELTARVWAKVRSGKGTAADATNLRACLGQLGMTPATRSKVIVPGEKAANEYADV